jgi:hypothetical protein
LVGILFLGDGCHNPFAPLVGSIGDSVLSHPKRWNAQLEGRSEFMKTLLIVWAFSIAALGQQRTQTCHAQGALRLATPFNTVYCKVNHKVRWAVNYDQVKNLLIVANPETGSFWYFPLYMNTDYRDTALMPQSMPAQTMRFKLTTGFKEDDYWIQVRFGNMFVTTGEVR